MLSPLALVCSLTLRCLAYGLGLKNFNKQRKYAQTHAPADLLKTTNYPTFLILETKKHQSNFIYSYLNNRIENKAFK